MAVKRGTPREATVVAQVRGVLQRRRAYFIKTQSGGYGGRAGTPDFLVCYRGFFVGMEVKRPGGKVSKSQERELALIERAGGVACVVESGQAAASVLDMVDSRVACAPDDGSNA